MAEWSNAPDSSSGPPTRAWVQIPLLTFVFYYFGFIFWGYSFTLSKIDNYSNVNKQQFYLNFFLFSLKNIKIKSCYLVDKESVVQIPLLTFFIFHF
ncbi:hypothetical protein QJS04_geneDACA022637 [Acorus gramineus]|uniref:ATP synthase F0 subunit 8 n=1 Tax=Acorus gramineus TaxID=55184 RepID=A0AAV9B4U3_ACOGR|nr:hypothetical protein QJS04_geneDACA022637 [Acorus gramineus]